MTDRAGSTRPKHAPRGKTHGESVARSGCNWATPPKEDGSVQRLGEAERYAVTAVLLRDAR